MIIPGRVAAPEDRQATEDVLGINDAIRVEDKSFCAVEFEDEQEQLTNPELLQAVTMLREDDLDEAGRDRRDQRRAEPEDVLKRRHEKRTKTRCA